MAAAPAPGGPISPRPALARANLTIATGALVTRIVVEKGRAVAVEYSQRGQSKTAHAQREIVLSAGACGSPQILMLSGIGQANDLRAAGITELHDLPGVGADLADHPVVINEWDLKGDHGLTSHLRMDRAAIAAARLFANGSGPFVQTGPLANIFTRLRPDVQMMCLPLSGDTNLWMPGLGKPVSRLTREIYNQPPLARLISHENLPGKACHTDAEITAFVRQTATHRVHPGCSCRMGHDAWRCGRL